MEKLGPIIREPETGCPFLALTST